MDTRTRLLLLLVCWFTPLITACVSDNHAPVYDAYQSPTPVTAGRHTVRAGETLYAIAWRYNRDFQDLARRNNIPKPYTIFPGQLLDLSLSSRSKSTKKAAEISHKKTKKVEKRYKKPPANEKRVQEKLANQRPNVVHIHWQWPAKGKVLVPFSERDGKGILNKGIDIAGERGERVSAAAAGQVVYAGSGLVGFGNLIIIKHTKDYLSAYAHNSKLLVQEGQAVKGGEKIAEIGASGTHISKLHFEIRHRGKPVNPLHHLPKRPKH